MSITYTEDVHARSIVRTERGGEFRQQLFARGATATEVWVDATLPQYGAESGVVSGLYLTNKIVRESEGGVRVELIFRTPELEPFETWAGIEQSGNAWNVDYQFGRELWRFSAAAQQEHITNVKSPWQVDDYGPASYGTTIGVQNDQVDGVDVFRPSLSIQVTRGYSTLRWADIQIMRNITGCVNNAAWFMFNAGEVLCTGIDADVDPSSNTWRVDFNFMVRQNPSPFNVWLLDGSVETIYANAWDYIWMPYGERVLDSVNPEESPVEAGDDLIMRRPKSVHVVRVQEYKDFGLLGLAGHGATT